MDLKDATCMILNESADHPELMRLSRDTFEELASGRQVPFTVLSDMLRLAARKNVFPSLVHKHGDQAFQDMVMAIGRQLDRQAPIHQG
ncbi:hypothetical protein [Actinomadura harenae]|nr:hypothetical protein [Actinomadura harenae]